MILRIALCDDHPIVREGLRRILSRYSVLRVELEVGRGADLLEAAAKKHFDIIILDIGLPDMSGLNVLKSLKVSGNRAAVLMLSMHSEEQFALRAMKAGADGYLTKESAPDELVAAIRRIAKGRKYLTESLAERLGLEDRRGSAPHEVLSDREFEVLCRLAGGKGVKQIASELALRPPTVATYRARVLQKLSLSTTVDLVRYALEHKLVP